MNDCGRKAIVLDGDLFLKSDRLNEFTFGYRVMRYDCIKCLFCLRVIVVQCLDMFQQASLHKYLSSILNSSLMN